MQGTRASFKIEDFNKNYHVVAIAKEAAEGGFFPDGFSNCMISLKSRPLLFETKYPFFLLVILKTVFVLK